MTAQQVCDALAYDRGIPGTSLHMIRLDREVLDALEARCKRIRRTVKRICPISKPLEWRYEPAGTADTIHTTSVSSAAKVTATKKLVAHLVEHPLDSRLKALERVHDTVSAPSRGRGRGRGRGQGGRGRGRPAAAAASPPAPAGVYAPPGPLQQSRADETAALKALEPGEGGRLLLQFGNGLWYGGQVIAYRSGDPSGVRFPNDRRVLFDDGDVEVVDLSFCRVAPRGSGPQSDQAEASDEEDQSSDEEEDEQEQQGSASAPADGSDGSSESEDDWDSDSEEVCTLPITKTRVMRVVKMVRAGTKRKVNDSPDEEDEEAEGDEEDEDEDEDEGDGTKRRDVRSLAIQHFREQVANNNIQPITPAAHSIKGLVTADGGCRWGPHRQGGGRVGTSRQTGAAARASAPRVHSGWSKRAKHGQGFGVRYMNRGESRAEVTKMFKIGMKVKARRKGPGEMLEVVERLHPDRYDLPSLEEVSQLVAKLHSSGLPKAGGAGRRGGRTTEEKFPVPIGALRAEFVSRRDAGMGMTARQAVEWMTRSGGHADGGEWPEGGPSEKQVLGVVRKWRKQPAAAVQTADGGGSESDDDDAGEWE